MKIPTPVLNSALSVCLPALTAFLLPSACRRKIAELKAQHEEQIAKFVETSRHDVLMNIAPIEFDHELIERDEKHMIHLIVGPYLRGAIAHYEAGNELECVRHVLLALTFICDVLEMKDASRYLNNKTRELYEIEQKRTVY